MPTFKYTNKHIPCTTPQKAARSTAGACKSQSHGMHSRKCVWNIAWLLVKQPQPVQIILCFSRTVMCYSVSLCLGSALSTDMREKSTWSGVRECNFLRKRTEPVKSMAERFCRSQRLRPVMFNSAAHNDSDEVKSQL